MNANFKPITGPEVCEFCIIQGGGGFQNAVLTLFIPEGGVLVRGHNILLILLVTGGMMEVLTLLVTYV